MPRSRSARPIEPSEDQLPRGLAPPEKSPDRCSRCGAAAVGPYICNPCKVALTVIGRRKKEAISQRALKARRKRNAEWSRRWRASRRDRS